METKPIETCDFEFDRKNHVTPKALQRFKVNMENDKSKLQDNDFTGFFDSDVQEVIKQHNTPQDRMRVNQMIRLLFATA